MKNIIIYFVCLLIVVLPGCSILTPQQKETVRQTVQQEYAAGNITAAQRDATLEALAQDKSFDWTTLGVVGVNLALALLGAPAIVRLQRGPPTQVVGLPQSKVKPA